MGKLDQNTPGASARRKAERLRADRERRTIERWPRLGRAILALSGPSPDERNWATGAAGEEILAASLEKRCPAVRFLHDRRMPGTTANIDHIAVAASGVWVIDAKRLTGTVEVSTPLFGAPKLTIDGRDRTKLIDGLERQVTAVKVVVGRMSSQAPVHGCLCFVAPEGLLADSGLPVLRTLAIRGYRLYYPRRLAKQLNKRGELAIEQATAIASELALRFPPA